MQSLQPGMIIDLRYFGDQDRISGLRGEIIDLDPVGILVRDLSGQAQGFPWTSVQRYIVSEPNGEVS